MKNIGVKVVEVKRKVDSDKSSKEPEKMRLVEEELIFDRKDNKWKLVKKPIVRVFEEP